MISTKLRDRTVMLLKNRSIRITYKQIAEATSIPEGWIKTFASGNVEGPDVNRVETLYEYLSKKKLSV